MPLIQKLPGGHQHGACKDQTKVLGGWEGIRKGMKRQSWSGQGGLCSQSKEVGVFAKCDKKPLEGFKHRNDNTGFIFNK